MEQTEKQKVQKNKYFRRKLMMSYFTSTVCIALVLYMAGLFFMLLFNTQHIGDVFRSNIKMTITLKDTKSQAEIDKFRKSLDVCEFVKDTKYISKAEAAEELKKDLGEDFIEILGNNPLYSQIEIRIAEKYSNMDSIEAITKRLEKSSAVDEVYYPRTVWTNATTVITKVATIVLMLTVILMSITIILISNSIRLQMTGDRFDIHTAKLIGASDYHISKPYIKRALVQSAIAALVSVGGLAFTISFIEKILNGVFQISAFYPTLGAMAAIGFVVTTLSAYVSIRKYLNASEDELYY